MPKAAVVGLRRAKGLDVGLHRALRGELRELRQLVLDLGGARAVGARKSFGVLAADWLARIAKRRVRPSYEEGHVKHMAPLMGMREGELTKGKIDTLFGDLAKPAGPLAGATVNKLRNTGRLIIRDAQGEGEWAGLNPFELVRRMRQPERLYDTLSVEEWLRVEPHLRPDRRREAKTVLLAGLRTGEVFGLLKTSVSLEKRMMRIHRSHGRDQTKTGREREFPIPNALLADLREAMKESPSEYVFPKPDGTRQRADTKLSRTLRTAFKAAGLVIGFTYICRRQDCGYRDDFEKEIEDERQLRCPHCNFKLWCSPIARPFRFYDLRHTAATLHRKAKCDPLVIQEALGWSRGNTMDKHYTHLDEGYRRRELNKLKLDEGSGVKRSK